MRWSVSSHIFTLTIASHRIASHRYLNPASTKRPRDQEFSKKKINPTQHHNDNVSQLNGFIPSFIGRALGLPRRYSYRVDRIRRTAELSRSISWTYGLWPSPNTGLDNISIGHICCTPYSLARIVHTEYSTVACTTSDSSKQPTKTPQPTQQNNTLVILSSAHFHCTLCGKCQNEYAWTGQDKGSIQPRIIAPPPLLTHSHSHIQGKPFETEQNS